MKALYADKALLADLLDPAGRLLFRKIVDAWRTGRATVRQNSQPTQKLWLQRDYNPMSAYPLELIYDGDRGHTQLLEIANMSRRRYAFEVCFGLCPLQVVHYQMRVTNVGNFVFTPSRGFVDRHKTVRLLKLFSLPK